jgi:hypothetical protein
MHGGIMLRMAESVLIDAVQRLLSAVLIHFVH